MTNEVYLPHLPECDKLQNHTSQVPCSCGRDAAIIQIQQVMIENFMRKEALKNIAINHLVHQKYENEKN